MKIIIIGAGTTGFTIGRLLIKENHDITIIERNPSVAEYVGSRLDCMVVAKSGLLPQNLEEAGIASADFLISVAGSDETNISCCLMAKAKYDNAKQILRVRSIGYPQITHLKNALGRNSFTVNPEREIAETIARITNQGAVSDIFNMTIPGFQIRYILVEQGSYFANKSILEIARETAVSFLIPLIMRGEEVIIPKADNVVLPDDIIYLSATEKNFTEILPLIGTDKKVHPLKRIVIVGGGSMGKQVIDELHNRERSKSTSPLFSFLSRIAGVAKIGSRFQIQVVEKNYTVCRELAAQYPQITVIHADITDEEIFSEENLSHADLLIAATEASELNIIAGLYGKTQNIKRSIAIVNSPNMRNAANRLGIDVVIDRRANFANSILEKIRGESLQGLKSLADGSVEVLEFAIDTYSPVLNKMIKEIQIPENVLIIFLLREGYPVLPQGDTQILIGDQIAVLSITDMVSEVEKLFAISGGSSL